MFRGNQNINLDSKGRVAIPARYRSRLQEKADGALIVAPGIGSPCLDFYPAPEWIMRVESKIESLPRELQMKLRRQFIGRAAECELDSNGRILLPAALREYAGLEKSAVLVGVGYKMELWEAGRWDGVVEEEALGEADLEMLKDVYF